MVAGDNTWTKRQGNVGSVGVNRHGEIDIVVLSIPGRTCEFLQERYAEQGSKKILRESKRFTGSRIVS